MKMMLLAQLLCWVSFLPAQNCRYAPNLLPANGESVYLAFDKGKQRYYLDGITRNGPRLAMITKVNGKIGAKWYVTYDPNRGIYNFDSGRRRQYLDGQTESGGLSLRDNTKYWGTNWILFHIGDGNFVLKAKSAGKHKFLAFDGQKVSMVEKLGSNTQGWKIIKN